MGPKQRRLGKKERNAQRDALQQTNLQVVRPVEIAPQPTPGGTALVEVNPMTMLARAIDQNCDLDKLERLMELQERWEANEARKAYTAAMAAFKVDPLTIAHNKGAKFKHKSGGGETSYSYATLDQVANIIAPALGQHGLSHGWAVEQSERGIEVTCTLTHELGHAESVALRASADNTGSKNPIQAMASTISYLERYTLLAITGLAAGDQGDDDGQSHGDAPPKPERADYEPAMKIPTLADGRFEAEPDGDFERIDKHGEPAGTMYHMANEFVEAVDADAQRTKSDAELIALWEHNEEALQRAKPMLAEAVYDKCYEPMENAYRKAKNATSVG